MRIGVVYSAGGLIVGDRGVSRSGEIDEESLVKLKWFALMVTRIGLTLAGSEVLALVATSLNFRAVLLAWRIHSDFF